LPDSAFRKTGSVAMSVLPSPVRISAILPLCSTMPPTSCTSKWRIFRVRLPPSRTTAKASGRMSSSELPWVTRWRSACTSPRSSSSLIFSYCNSMAPMRSTTRRYCLSRRSLRLPKIWVRSLGNMGKHGRGQG
jgi:hypothetical protein